MWTITGPFDALEKNDSSTKKTKLLKTDSRYILGRKDRQLVVNNAKVSHDHAVIIVGAHSADYVSDPSAIPTLSIHNTSKKVIVVYRGGAQLLVGPSGTEDLQDGDIADIITGVPLSLRWLQVCALASAKSSKTFSIDACASLGINLVYTSHERVTHHLIPQFLAIAAIATSLVSAAQLVKPEWLHEVIRLGNLPIGDDPSNGSSLEQVCTLPAESKFRPAFSASLPPLLKSFKVWEPNEERVNMFIGYTFLFVGERGREAENSVTELVARGGGEGAKFNVSAGLQVWHRLLAKEQKKQRDKKGLIVVADGKAMSVAIGSQEWHTFQIEAKSFEAACISPDTLVQAVLYTDISLLAANQVVQAEEESGDRFSSPLPEFVPNTLPEEPSYPPPTESPKPQRNLRRRVTPSVESRPPTPPKEPGPVEDGPPPPRKVLKRRTRATTPSIADLNDIPVADAGATALDLASTADTSMPVMFTDDSAPVTTRSSRLKRRAGTAASTLANNQTFESGFGQAPETEPPLKKFKALFDASHPDQKDSATDDDTAASYEPQNSQIIILQGGSQTQSGSTLASKHGRDLLAAVAEEEEESTPTQARGVKRKPATDEGGMATESIEAAPLAKRRAQENVNSVQPVQLAATQKPPSSTKRTALTSGAAIGKPDMDTAFLKAIASTKKGKKAEDSFDREFNKLKISKPDVQRDEQETEWAILDDFGEDCGIRGNFMVVMEMEVYSKGNGDSRRNGISAQWSDRPNFKKFKKKSNAVARAAVELVVHEDNDYGMGAAYWKGHSQSQSQSDHSQRITTQSDRRGRGFVANYSDEDAEAEAEAETEEPLPIKRKPPATAKPPPNGSQIRRSTGNHAKSGPLFLDSDEDSEDKVIEIPLDIDRDHDDDAMTLQSESTSRPKSSTAKRGSKKVPVIVDDDSDDGATFKGFRGKARGAR